ncbi:MAG TPA: phosphate ABC transporter substrate-binding protein PstS [Micromonosporaceae bacterium]|nr:phosphate ABC transporter substrate-binding protein PstS [Micromonosporaceae bacterium]
MKLQRLGILAGAVLTATALAACGSDNGGTPSGSSSGNKDCATGTLNAQGSTAQGNAMTTWISNYQKKCAGATINYGGGGSGAGQQAFIAGTADFAGSDSPLSATDQPKADAHCGSGGHAIHLPMVVGPIAVVYNVSGVTNLQLKPATLAGIFSGKITKWNDPAIAADNQGANLPATTITSVHRAESSGTTDNFTKYLTGTAGSAWTYDHDKVWHAPGGDAEQGSDGVSAQIKKTDGSIGYVEWSFATLNSLNMAKIYNGAGEWSELTADSAGKTIAGAKVTGTGNDMQMSIDYNTSTAGAYPIVLVTYEIVCDKGNPAGSLALLKSFLAYTSSTDGQSQLTAIGYAPLPETVRSGVAAKVAALG